MHVLYVGYASTNGYQELYGFLLQIWKKYLLPANNSHSQKLIKVSNTRIVNTRQQRMLNFMRYKKPVLLKISEFTHKLSAQCNLSSFRIMHA